MKLVGQARWAAGGVGTFRAPLATPGPIVVDGARELAGVLARQISAGGNDAAVRTDGGLAGACALIWIGEADEDKLRAASRAGVPLVGITDGESLPYVLDTDLIVLEPGEGFPVDRIAAVLARRIPEEAAAHAARLPALRDGVSGELVRTAALRNAGAAGLALARGTGMPLLTLSQIRLVRRLSIANGEMPGNGEAHVAGLMAAAITCRRVAREATAMTPRLAWAIRAAVAYAGTRAVGEAARARLRS